MQVLFFIRGPLKEQVWIAVAEGFRDVSILQGQGSGGEEKRSDKEEA